MSDVHRRDVPLLPPRGEGQVLATEHYVDRETEDSYQPVPGFEGMEQRAFSLWRGTEGRYGMFGMRVSEGYSGSGESPWHTHSSDQMVYILEGWVVAEYEGLGVVKLEKGDAVFEDKRNRHRQLQVSPDLKSLQVLIPAEMSTTWLTWDAGQNCYQSTTVQHEDLMP
jgi:quercetin dioxygenase-like cupin family protein